MPRPTTIVGGESTIGACDKDASTIGNRLDPRHARRQRCQTDLFLNRPEVDAQKLPAPGPVDQRELASGDIQREHIGVLRADRADRAGFRVEHDGASGAPDGDTIRSRNRLAGPDTGSPDRERGRQIRVHQVQDVDGAALRRAPQCRIADVLVGDVQRREPRLGMDRCQWRFVIVKRLDRHWRCRYEFSRPHREQIRQVGIRSGHDHHVGCLDGHEELVAADSGA